MRAPRVGSKLQPNAGWLRETVGPKLVTMVRKDGAQTEGITTRLTSLCRCELLQRAAAVGPPARRAKQRLT